MRLEGKWFTVYKWLEGQLRLPLHKKNKLFLLITAPFAIVYALYMTARRWLYKNTILKSMELPGVVISLGNVSLGGTGKTPAVSSLANEIRGHGYSVVVLTRGYGSDVKSGETLILIDGEIIFESRAFEVIPDEAMLLSHKLKNCAIVVGPDRTISAKVAIGLVGQPACWILDDGFQHMKIRRSIDVVMISADSLSSLPALPLPTGLWRESLVSLRNADYIVLTKANAPQDQELFQDLLSKISKYGKPVPPHGQAISTFSPPFSLNSSQGFDTAGQRINVLCGIANPDQLFNSLRSMGFSIEKHLSLADHALFREDMLGKFDLRFPVVITAKDYWRQAAFFDNNQNFSFLIADYSLKMPSDLTQICLDHLRKS